MSRSPFSMNVYCLYFPNGKRYFGIESKTGSRISSHKTNAAKWRVKPRPQLVSKAIAKYSWEKITWRYLVTQVSQDFALALEALLIAVHKTQDPDIGYNVDPGGGKYRRGMKASEETKQRQRESQLALNRKMPSKQKEILREIQRTRVRTPEERAKIAASLRGRKRSPEAIEKHREKMRGRKLQGKELENVRKRLIERNSRPVSDETRRKMSESAKKRKASEETRRKISEGNRGKVISEEHRRKLREAHTGRKHSPEHVEKMRLKKLGQPTHNKGKKLVILPNGTQKYVDKIELDL